MNLQPQSNFALFILLVSFVALLVCNVSYSEGPQQIETAYAAHVRQVIACGMTEEQVNKLLGERPAMGFGVGSFNCSGVLALYDRTGIAVLYAEGRVVSVQKRRTN